MDKNFLQRSHNDSRSPYQREPNEQYISTRYYHISALFPNSTKNQSSFHQNQHQYPIEFLLRPIENHKTIIARHLIPYVTFGPNVSNTHSELAFVEIPIAWFSLHIQSTSTRGFVDSRRHFLDISTYTYCFRKSSMYYIPYLYKRIHRGRSSHFYKPRKIFKFKSHLPTVKSQLSKSFLNTFNFVGCKKKKWKKNYHYFTTIIYVFFGQHCNAIRQME